MSSVYQDILKGFKEIGEIEGNDELKKKADNYLIELEENSISEIRGSIKKNSIKKIKITA